MLHYLASMDYEGLTTYFLNDIGVTSYIPFFNDFADLAQYKSLPVSAFRQYNPSSTLLDALSRRNCLCSISLYTSLAIGFLNFLGPEGFQYSCFHLPPTLANHEAQETSQKCLVR